MGRIKSALVKRTARQLVEKMPETFNDKFEGNSKALRGTMPSKRIKNMVAGYITRIKRNTHKLIQE